MKWFNDFTFQYPWVLALLLIPIWLIWRHVRDSRNQFLAVYAASLEPFIHIKRNFKESLVSILPWLKLTAIIMVILAMARPQGRFSGGEYSIEGIDIMLVNDISGSMLTEDLRPNRLKAAKSVAQEFIAGRPNDRIGLVAFSGVAFTQCPLTADHSALLQLLGQLRNGVVRDGTAIGDAVGIAVDRLRYSQAAGKVIILLTDGMNNCGSVDPGNAASMATMYGIRLYTIGVGSKQQGNMIPGMALSTSGQDAMIDEELLTRMADLTGGRYFRATDNESLDQIYKEIDQMERTRMEVARMSDRRDLFFLPVFFALVLLLVEIVLRYFVLRPIP